MKLTKSIFLTAAILVTTLYSSAQTKEDNKPSCPEKWWAITHPFIACKAHKLSIKASKTATAMLSDTSLDHDGNGGQVDAFRHAYWMALLAQHIAPRKARKLGKAHEKGDYIAFKKRRMEEGELPDSMASVMDLANNDSGIAIGMANEHLPEDALKDLVKEKVIAGEMKILKKDSSKNYLRCDGETIDISHYVHLWNIPKCLVSSNANHY